jgi:Xaa-Pro aminopeptidase
MFRTFMAAALMLAGAASLSAQTPRRPFGTVREQAALQQQWLDRRMTTILPPLLKEHGVGCWVIPMREYNEDPVFRALVAPTTFAARRRTIYLLCDRGADGVERVALGGTDQGGVYRAVRASKPLPDGGTAELWGDDQWRVLREQLEARTPATVAINRSQIFAFADGLTAGEYEGMVRVLGEPWRSRFRDAEGLAVDFLALRLAEEEVAYRRMQELVWELTQRMFSAEVITPGVTRTSDLVWWWRQQVADLGIGTWFQPTVDVQRAGTTSAQLGADPVIQRGDVLHCDVGISVYGLHTDTQHLGYVLREGETAAPAGLRAALVRSNRLQDILFEETRVGRTGNEVLAAARATMRAEGLDGTIYTHPIGLHGHGAGPLIGLWDYQDGVPGRGDHKVRANTWFSSELQVTTPVAEWGGQRVRMAQEEDFTMGDDGRPRWFLRRQTDFFLVR